MWSTIALVIGLAAVPAAAQRTPITKLLDKIPSVFGSGQATNPKSPAGHTLSLSA